MTRERLARNSLTLIRERRSVWKRMCWRACSVPSELYELLQAAEAFAMEHRCAFAAQKNEHTVLCLRRTISISLKRQRREALT